MGETTDQIESHIQHQREDLQSNLQELEDKVKSVTDWRGHFRNHPGVMVAAAFGGGVLLSAMISRRSGSGRVKIDSSTSEVSTSSGSSSIGRAASKGTSEILETWDTIKSALIGTAATKFKGLLGDVVPGFKENLDKTESRRRTPQSGGASQYGAVPQNGSAPRNGGATESGSSPQMVDE